MQHRKILARIAAVACLVGSAIAAEAPRLIAPLKNQQAIDGCSWSAFAPTIGHGFIFLAEYDESRIVMYIGGSDVELKAVEGRGELKKVGDELFRTFQAGDV